MGKALLFLMTEFGFLTVIVGIISGITWTKMTLGAALSVIGAFFPSHNRENPEGGHASITLFGNHVTFKGAARFAVIVSGILLILGALFDSVSVYTLEKANSFAAQQRSGGRSSLDYEDIFKELCAEPNNKTASFCKE